MLKINSVRTVFYVFFENQLRPRSAYNTIGRRVYRRIPPGYVYTGIISAGPNISPADISSALLTESRSLSIFQYRAAKTILFNKMEICRPAPSPSPHLGPGHWPSVGAFEYLPRLNSYNEAPFKSQNLFGQVDKKSMPPTPPPPPANACVVCGNDENSPPSNERKSIATTAITKKVRRRN